MSEYNMAISSVQAEFLIRLADLCETFNADFSPAESGDGIRIILSGVEIFSGELDFDAAEILREAVERCL